MSAFLALLALLACGAVGSACTLPGSSAGAVTIVVNAPFAASPWVGRAGKQGAQLAADQINNRNGVKIGGASYRIKIRTLDHQATTATAVSNIEQAVRDKAVAVIDDGSTAAATAGVAEKAGLPVLVYFDGTTKLVDPGTRPNLFRLAPSNQTLAGRLVPYLTAKGLRLALVHDETTYGIDGADQVRQALAGAGATAAADVEARSGQADYQLQGQQVIASPATAVVIWAGPGVVAGVLKSLREQGSRLPVYTGPTGEDPGVRIALRSRPDWVQGLTFTSIRITDAVGLARWQQYRVAYETLYGEDRLGLGESIRRPVVQPPDWQMLSYDMVYLVKAALEKAGTADTANGKLVAALADVQVDGANGTRVGWTGTNHDGIPSGQVYFAVILNLNFQPIQDDAISKAQPQVEQD